MLRYTMRFRTFEPNIVNIVFISILLLNHLHMGMDILENIHSIYIYILLSWMELCMNIIIIYPDLHVVDNTGAQRVSWVVASCMKWYICYIILCPICHPPTALCSVLLEGIRIITMHAHSLSPSSSSSKASSAALSFRISTQQKNKQIVFEWQFVSHSFMQQSFFLNKPIHTCTYTNTYFRYWSAIEQKILQI